MGQDMKVRLPIARCVLWKGTADLFREWQSESKLYRLSPNWLLQTTAQTLAIYSTKGMYTQVMPL